MRSCARRLAFPSILWTAAVLILTDKRRNSWRGRKPNRRKRDRGSCWRRRGTRRKRTRKGTTWWTLQVRNRLLLETTTRLSKRRRERLGENICCFCNIYVLLVIWFIICLFFLLHLETVSTFTTKIKIKYNRNRLYHEFYHLFSWCMFCIPVFQVKNQRRKRSQRKGKRKGMCNDEGILLLFFLIYFKFW